MLRILGKAPETFALKLLFCAFFKVSLLLPLDLLRLCLAKLKLAALLLAACL